MKKSTAVEGVNYNKLNYKKMNFKASLVLL